MLFFKDSAYRLPLPPAPPRTRPLPMAPVKSANTYTLDIIEAAERLQDAWSLTQAEDALRSLEHFTRAARQAYELTLGKEDE